MWSGQGSPVEGPVHAGKGMWRVASRGAGLDAPLRARTTIAPPPTAPSPVSRGRGLAQSLRSPVKSTLLSIAILGLMAACTPQTATPPTPATPAATTAPTPATPGKPLVVYTSRNEQLVKPLFDRYTADTGVKVTYLTDKAPPLMERLRAEGNRTEADVLITVDAANLWQAANLGLLQPIDSPALQANIPVSYTHLTLPTKRIV